MEPRDAFDDVGDLPARANRLSVQEPISTALPEHGEASSDNPWIEQAEATVPISPRSPHIMEETAKVLETEQEREATMFEQETKPEVPQDILNEFDPLADREEKDARDAWSHADSHPPPASPIKGLPMPEATSPQAGSSTSTPGHTPSSSFPSSLASFARSFTLNRSARTRPQSQTIDSPAPVSSTTLQSFADQQNKPRTSGDLERLPDDGSAQVSESGPDSDKSKAPPFDFQKFLDQMKSKSAEPVAKYLRSFLSNFAKRSFTVNEQVKVINDFLGFISQRMRESDVWRNNTEAEFDNAMEAMEKLIMNRLYDFTFTPQLAMNIPPRPITTTDDLERDDVLAQRIALFGWIDEKHLDVPSGGMSSGFLEFAQQELLKINHYKAPRDKLICILNCCKVIFGLIRHAKMDEGADAFVPVLIFVVLKANPPNLLSNVEYINRFRNPDKLRSEAGYYLSSLMGAISFIETMDHTSLSNITAEEFERNMEEAVQRMPKDPESSYERDLLPVPSPVTARLGPSSPHAGEESAQPLTLPAPGPSLTDEFGSSLADDTRRFLLKTGDTISKPLNALGRIFSEALDGAEGRLQYLPGPFAPYDLAKENNKDFQSQSSEGNRQNNESSLLSGIFQTPYKPRVRLTSAPTSSPAPPSSGVSTSSQASSSLYGTGYTPDGTPSRGGVQFVGSLPVSQTHASGLPPHIAQELLGVSPHPSRTPTPNLDISGLQDEIDRAHEQASAAALGTLNQIFPDMDTDVLSLVLEANDGDLGRCIEALLEMSGGG